jgi:hypothetical protein
MGKIAWGGWVALQAISDWYRDWAQRLAEWGFVVVQYDYPRRRLTSLSTEVQFSALHLCPSLLQCLYALR